MTVAELMVRIGADISALGTSLKKAEGELGDFTNMTEAASFATGQLALAAGAAGAAILAAMGIATKAAADAEREQALLANAIRASGKAIDIGLLSDQATAMQHVTGVADEQTKAMQRLLIQYGATQHQVTELVPRILDFAAATGRDAADSAIIFGRALTGQEQALKRVLGKFGEGIDLAGNFDQAMAELDKRFGGTARTAGEQLAGAIAKLRANFNDLLEVLGAPILRPLVVMVTALANAAVAVTQFAKANPILVQALAGVALGIGVLLAGTGGLIAMQLAWTRLAPLIVTTTGVLKTFTDGTIVAAEKTVLTTRALVALKAVGLAGVIGLLVLLILKLGQANGSFDQFGAQVLKARAFLEGYDEARRRGATIAQAWAAAHEAAAQDFKMSQDAIAAAANAAKSPIEKLDKSIEDLTEDYNRAAAAAHLLATKDALVATQMARSKLGRPGLRAEDIEAIEAERQAAIQRGTEQELRIQLTGRQNILDRLLKEETKALAELSLARGEDLAQAQKHADDVTARRVKAEQDYVDVATKLDDVRRTSAEDTAQRVAAAVQHASEVRLGVEKDTIAAELKLLQQRIENTRMVESERLQVEQQIRARRLELLRLEEDMRIGMLRRMADLEIQLQGDLLSARETVLRVQVTRMEALEIAAASRRAKAVADGLLWEEDARKQADAARLAREKVETEGELALAQQRIANIKREFEIAQGLAVAEAESKKALLVSELQAKRDTLIATTRFREAEFKAAVALAEAETKAKIAELNAELNAKIAVARAELAAARSPEEKRARQEAIDALIEGQKQAVAALGTGFVERSKAIADQMVAMQGGARAEMEAIDRESAIRREAIDRDLQATLIGLTSKNVADRAKALQDLADLQKRLAQTVADEEVDLRAKVAAGEITQAEADKRLAPLRALAANIDRLLKGEQMDVEGMLGPLDKWRQAVADRLKELKPLADMVAGMMTGKTPTIPAPPIGAVQPAAAVAIVGAGGVSNVFTFQGTTFNLTADETALLNRIITTMMGPEGAAILERIIKRQPGPR